jgi:hypothetical protein
MKKLALLLTLFSFAAQAGTNPVIWGPGNKATVIPPILVVGSIQTGGSSGGSSAPATSTWTSPTTVTGTVSNGAGGTAVTGVGTKFLTEFHPGDTITINAETQTIASIASDTAMTTSAWTGANSGATATRSAVANFFIYPNGNLQSGGSRTNAVNLLNSGNAFYLVATASSGASTSVPSASYFGVGYTGANTGSSNPPVLTLVRSRGTEASPVAVGSGDQLGLINFRGYDGSSLGSTSGRITTTSTEAFSGSAHGTKISFQVTPNTTTTLTTAFTIDQDLSGTFAGAIKFSNILMSPTAPTVSSGFGTSPSIASNNGTAAFTVNVGTGGSATNGVIGLPTATTGWNCFCADITTQSSTVFSCKQTGSSTTTATIGNFNTSGAAAAWVASDIVRVSCFAY